MTSSPVISMNGIMKNCNKCPIGYNKLTTAGNDPKINQALRSSQYLQTVKPSKHYADTYGYLDQRGLVFQPIFKQTVIPPSSFIVTDIVFPRNQIYITAIQRNIA
jgi:hypothetical protein